MKPKHKPKVTEHGEQCAVIDWCFVQNGKYKPANRIFAVPNMAKRSYSGAQYMKNEGMRKGIPDLFLLHPVGKYHGLIIEMKSVTGKVSPEQKSWLSYFNGVNYFTYTAWSADEAIEVIKEYLK